VLFLQIKALEGEHAGDVLTVNYDENKLVLDRAVIWQRQPNKGPGDLLFERVETTHLSLVLLWEHMAEPRPIQPDLDQIQRWADVDATLHRPPKLEVSWGKAANAIPSFVGVIESLSISYAGAIGDNGVPLHAAVDMRLARAVHLRAPA
jgi:hypothetical protein